MSSIACSHLADVGKCQWLDFICQMQWVWFRGLWAGKLSRWAFSGHLLNWVSRCQNESLSLCSPQHRFLPTCLLLSPELSQTLLRDWLLFWQVFFIIKVPFLSWPQTSLLNSSGIICFLVLSCHFALIYSSYICLLYNFRLLTWIQILGFTLITNLLNIFVLQNYLTSSFFSFPHASLVNLPKPGFLELLQSCYLLFKSNSCLMLPFKSSSHPKECLLSSIALMTPRTLIHSLGHPPL